ncbi:hypothetical protein Pfo_017390 [Paulownia fortunei]|nr:hypothetical protein Pfo_017390 [Paulownia fortunei]
MNARLTPNFRNPPASLQSIPYIMLIFMVPLYETTFVPLARRITRKDTGISPLHRVGSTGLFIATFSKVSAAITDHRRRLLGLNSFLVSLVNKIAPATSSGGGWLSDNDLNKDRLGLFSWLLVALRLSVEFSGLDGLKPSSIRFNEFSKFSRELNYESGGRERFGYKNTVRHCRSVFGRILWISRSNLACAITKLGGHFAFIGKVGEDEFGRMLVDILKKNGVKSDGVCFDQHARTALAFVTLKRNREREFMFYRNPSVGMLLKESELDFKMIKQANIFHFHKPHIRTVQLAFLLSYDLNVRLPLWPFPEAASWDGIKSIWNQADFIKAVREDEAEFLTRKDAQKEDVVMSLWLDQLKLLVVTDGEKGCRYFTKAFKGRVAGLSVKTVDTTGAGYAFVGGTRAKLDRFCRMQQILDQKVANPALPTPSDAQALIAHSKEKSSDFLLRGKNFRSEEQEYQWN